MGRVAPHPDPLPASGERGTSVWPGLLRRAVAAGIAPDAFWRMSWREWRMLMGEAAPAMERAALEALMRRFPDGG